MKHSKIAMLLGLLLLAITACQPQEEKLPFETIAQGDGFFTGRSYGGEEPNLLIITEPNEVDSPGLDVEFPSELANQLRHLDYDRFLAVLVLQGLKHQGGYSVTVQQIVRRDDRVNVYVEFTSPEPGTRRIQAFTSPYHLVVVSKEGKWGRQIKFILISDSEPVAEAAYFIP